MDQSLNNLVDYSEGGILNKVILKSYKMNVTLFCMAKGTEISEHASTKSGLSMWLKGTVSLTSKVGHCNVSR